MVDVVGDSEVESGNDEEKMEGRVDETRDEHFYLFLSDAVGHGSSLGPCHRQPLPAPVHEFIFSSFISL